MADTYTPTTEQVIQTYVYGRTCINTGFDAAEEEQDVRRWHDAELAAAERRGAVRALREAADELGDTTWKDSNWLRDRADHIERGDDDRATRPDRGGAGPIKRRRGGMGGLLRQTSPSRDRRPGPADSPLL